jgi:dihydrofolate synthase / folylpolyglutamate synthase
MDYSESVSYLYALGHEVLAAKYRLETIGALLEELGNPHHAFKSVLIAGTNGKGSTAAMIESIARAGDIVAGLYTSPHLVRVEERIKVAGREIAGSEFARLASRVRQAAELLVENGSLDAPPSFFEQVTAIAFCHFQEAGVPLAILEVGLGGRLDATNIVDPVISVITSIDYDHQQVLGSEITHIAAEKAAIIKKGSRAVIGRQDHRDATEVLMRRCLDVELLPVFTSDPIFEAASDDGYFTFDYSTAHSTYSSLRLRLRGRHQMDNAAAAIETAELLADSGFPITREAIVRGLRKVDWPARLELIDIEPRVLLDGAHNPGGALRLRQYLDEFWPEQFTLIFGAMADKDIKAMAERLFSRARTIVLTRVRDRRAASIASMGEAAMAGSRNVIFTETVKQALSWARSVTSRKGLIVVAGSLHLAGAIKQALDEEDRQTAFFGISDPDGTRAH